MARVPSSDIRNYEPLLLFLGGTLLLFLGKALLIPLAFSLTLCFLVLPLLRPLERHRVPRSAAVAIVAVVTCVSLALGAWFLSRQTVQLSQTLQDHRETLRSRVAALHSPAEDSIERALNTLTEVSADLSHGPSSQPVPVRLVPGDSRLQFAYSVAGVLLKPLAEIGIVIIFAMYMLMRREELRHRLLMIAGTGQLGVMTRALDEAAHRISKYLLMQLAVNACYGVLFGAGMYLIHVPNAILWGVIAGVLRIVPYVGTAMGMVLPLLASVAVSPNWWHPLLVLAWFVFLEVTSSYFLEPSIFSSRTGISSLALLVSAIFWTMLWGWPGLALATPMTVCVVVVAQYVPQLSFLHSLLGTDAQLSPAAHFYERLLATDHAEAFAIAERFLRDKPLLELYDAVLIRALTLAKGDRHRGMLDEARFRFLLLSVGEFIALLADVPQTTTELPAYTNGLPRREAMRPATAKEIAVVCISAAEAPDQLTTQMMTHVLEHSGFQTLTLTTDGLSSEILSALAAEKDTIVVISALPPFGFAQARSICHRVREHLQENRIAVALWSSAEDHEDTASRFGPGRPNAIVATLAQTVALVNSWQEVTPRV